MAHAVAAIKTTKTGFLISGFTLENFPATVIMPSAWPD